MKKTISKTAPDTTLAAYGYIQDLMDAVGALRVAGMSDVHKLELPQNAIQQLGLAHEALKGAHREVERALQAAEANVGPIVSPKKELWIWYWAGGGYNSCQATSREEALKKAREIGASTGLVLNEHSLHVGTYGELSQLAAGWD